MFKAVIIKDNELVLHDFRSTYIRSLMMTLFPEGFLFLINLYSHEKVCGQNLFIVPSLISTLEVMTLSDHMP